MTFQEIDIREIQENLVKMICDDWMLLTAGRKEDFNTMTASWGTIGELWGKDVAMVFVRPQRHTFSYMEQGEYFTLTFFGGGYKKEMGICGSKSGRDIDKVQATGLTPVFAEEAPYFAEGTTVLICRKLAVTEMNPADFLDEEIEKNYAKKDYHNVYIGEIIKVLQK